MGGTGQGTPDTSDGKTDGDDQQPSNGVDGVNQQPVDGTDGTDQGRVSCERMGGTYNAQTKDCVMGTGQGTPDTSDGKTDGDDQQPSNGVDGVNQQPLDGTDGTDQGRVSCERMGGKYNAQTKDCVMGTGQGTPDTSDGK